MGGYLDLVRRAATREERHETAEGQTRKGGDVYLPIGQSPALAHESYAEANSPVTQRGKSDQSDQSPDYRAVVDVLRAPPYWLRDSYMAGYRRGTLSLHALSGAVAAALRRSPYAWAEQLKPIVEQVLKKQQEATDIDGQLSQEVEHAEARGGGGHSYEPMHRYYAGW